MNLFEVVADGQSQTQLVELDAERSSSGRKGR